MKKKKNTADEVSAQKIKYRHATLAVSLLETNSGQIDGLPRNPRLIKGDKFKALRKSVGEDPDMMEIRPVVVVSHGEKFVILGGNMRTEAARANGQETVPCIVIDQDTPMEWMREFVLKDNGDFGEWDWDMLANEWDDMDFAMLGVGVPTNFYTNDEGENKSNDDGIDVDKIVAAASSEAAMKEYSEDTNYDLNRLYRQRINSNITSAIEDGITNNQIRPEIADVLKTRATQCSIFNFDELCKYYRSEDATETEKELLRRLYLVYVAPKELIKKGILTVRAASKDIYDDELMTKGGGDE